MADINELITALQVALKAKEAGGNSGDAARLVEQRLNEIIDERIREKGAKILGSQMR
jgi:hypothetical protein